MGFWNTVRDYAHGGENHKLAIDEETRALITVGPLGNNLARGETFSFAETITLENGIDRDYVITTPTAPPTIDVSFLAEVETSDIAQLEFFEDTEFTGGSAVVAVDLNRRTKSTCLAVITADATISADGTKLPFDTQLGFAGKGNDSFGGAAGGGLLLTSATNYMIRITSLSAGNIININLTLIEAVDRI